MRSRTEACGFAGQDTTPEKRGVKVQDVLGTPLGTGVDEATLLEGMQKGKRYFVVVGGSAEDHAVGMVPTGRKPPFTREDITLLDRQNVFKWSDTYTFWEA